MNRITKEDWSVVMNRLTISTLNPELVIGTTEAIDRMGLTASQAVELGKPNFIKQIQLVRSQAKGLCPAYKNCREEDFCFLCASGQGKQQLFLGKTCLDCKLLSSDVRLVHIDGLVGGSTNPPNQSHS